ncbi:MAG TPA: acyl-ACP--UDP-N-acetylglucosamine O-acyltransferase [Salinivirgaceae bacterium]|nr:acyl-ACP--UDP-N-acetylglucosamine O-acyltransferase [Salinivirgaceae bacterium]
MNNPQAYIHPDAKIGNNVRIDPFAYIDADVIIGDNCWIGPHATIFAGSRIGNNCRVFPGAVIGAIPQDLKFAGEYTTAEIGDNTTIREAVTVNRGTAAKGKTVVGKNVLLMACAHVGHDTIIGNNVIVANAVLFGGEVVVDDFAVIGGGSAIHQFVHIGAYSMLAGGSLVGKDIPPFVKAARYPVSYCGVNSVGLRRRNFSNETIQHIQDIYRILFLKGFNYSDAIKYIETEMPESKEKDEIVSFVKNSKRGIMKGYGDE